MDEKSQKQSRPVADFFKNWFAKMDKKLEKKSRQQGCCCSREKPDQESCCG